MRALQLSAPASSNSARCFASLCETSPPTRSCLYVVSGFAWLVAHCMRSDRYRAYSLLLLDCSLTALSLNLGRNGQQEEVCHLAVDGGS